MKQYIEIGILMDKTKYSLQDVYHYLNGSAELTEAKINKLQAAQEKMNNTKRASLAREYKIFKNMVKAMDECDFGQEHADIYNDTKNYVKDLEDAIFQECTHIANAKELQGITWKEVMSGEKKDVVINYYLKKHRVSLSNK